MGKNSAHNFVVLATAFLLVGCGNQDYAKPMVSQSSDDAKSVHLPLEFQQVRRGLAPEAITRAPTAILDASAAQQKSIEDIIQETWRESFEAPGYVVSDIIVGSDRPGLEDLIDAGMSRATAAQVYRNQIDPRVEVLKELAAENRASLTGAQLAACFSYARQAQIASQDYSVDPYLDLMAKPGTDLYKACFEQKAIGESGDGEAGAGSETNEDADIEYDIDVDTEVEKPSAKSKAGGVANSISKAIEKLKFW